MLNCKTCNFGFCSKHRFPEDHECKKPEEEKTILDHTYDLGKQLGLIHKENKESREKKKIEVKKSTKVNPKKMIEKNFSNSKLKPVGSSNIDYEDKFELDVYFPMKNKVQPIHMFFDQKWKIGKILDLICKEGKIINNNLRETDPEKKLSLFHLRNGTK